jgi:hypothetical protein
MTAGSLLSVWSPRAFRRHPDLDLVEDVGDGFHGVGHDSFAEVFLDRDQPDAALEQEAFGDGGVGEVPKRPRAHVDDHVFDVGVIEDVAQQLLEDGPLLDALPRGTRFDELFAHGGPKRMGLPLQKSRWVAIELPSASTSAPVSICRALETRR